MFPLHRKLFGFESRQTRRDRRGHLCKPRFERLEDRLAPAIWNPIGPAPILNGQTPGGDAVTGRINALAADPTDANTIYIAAAGGGVWKTGNGGTSWTALTDNQNTLVMGGIAVALGSDINHRIIYAGTGDPNIGPTGFYGRGVLISKDSGATWTLTGNSVFNRSSIGKVVIDPTDPTGNTAYVAVSGIPTNGVNRGFTGNYGIWKTTTGGATWTNTTASVVPPTGTNLFTDLVMDPGHPSTLYAAVGTTFGVAANGVYETTTGGTSWMPLASFPGGTGAGRISLAIADVSSSTTLYASIAAPISTVTKSIQKSTDGGQHWNPVMTQASANYVNYMGSQGDYDQTLIIDPSDPTASTVYAAGQLTVIKTTDGGTAWPNISSGADGHGPHADHHGIGFDASGRLLDGNDGGLWRLDNPTVGSIHWTDLNGSLQITQFNNVALDPTNPSTAYGASQDNGTEKYTGSSAWNLLYGGDGFLVRVDPSNPMRIYTEAPSTTATYLVRSDNGGTNFNSKFSGNRGRERYVLDPANPNRLVLGTDAVNQSLNNGDNWMAIGTPGVNGFNPGDAGINTIATLGNTVYAATEDGHVWVTTNNGSSWTSRDPIPGFNAIAGGVPGGFQDLEVDAGDATGQTAYIVTAEFSEDIDGTSSSLHHVFRTTNAGGTWTDISGNLPDLPTWSIAIDHVNNTLYVGNDTGVYFSTNGGISWSPFGTGLPNVTVFSLQYVASLHLLAAGTYGRGAFEIDTTRSFSPGDVFVSVSSGQVQWRHADGTLVQTLDTGLDTAPGFTTGMNFDAAGNLYVTDFTAGTVSRFSNSGTLLGTFGSGYSTSPESLVVDASANLYVGTADGDHLVRKFSPSGTPLATYAVATEDRGSDWIDLAPDQHTLFYTSEGKSIKRFDVGSNTQLPDFAGPLPGSIAFALRLLPDGGLLVADSESILRLDASGNIIHTYTVSGDTNWFGLNLDPDGRSFWAVDRASSDVYKFDIATGTPLLHFNTGTPTLMTYAVAVFSTVQAQWVNFGDVAGSASTARQALVDASALSGTNTFYVSIYQPTATHMYDQGQIADLITRAHSRGIQVWAQYGNPDWPSLYATGGNSSFPIQRLQDVINYNAANPTAKIDGIMLDVEWDSTGAFGSLNTFLGQLLPFYQGAQSYLKQNASALRMGAAIQVALWDGAIPNFSHQVIDVGMDEVVVMGYRNYALPADAPNGAPADGIIGLDQSDLQYAVGKETRVLAGLETQPANPPSLPSYATFGSLANGNAALTDVSQRVTNYAVSQRWTLGGFAIDLYAHSYLSGSPGWPVPKSAAQSAAAQGTMTTGTTPTTASPVETSVTTPNAGPVSIQEGGTPPTPFTSFQFSGQSPVGEEVYITAPAATPTNPLTLVFKLLVPAGTNPNSIQVYKNGVLVQQDPAGSTTASPYDPGIIARTAVGTTEVDITILTSTASTWDFTMPFVATTTAVGSSIGPSTYGQAVTFTASVTAGGQPVTSGTITFLDFGTVLASRVPLNNSGQAVFSSATLTAGMHSITAIYSSSGTIAASSGALNQTVNPAPLAVTADNQTRAYGQANPTLTASYSGFVLGQGPGVLGGSLALSTPAGPASPVGSYLITPAGLVSSNYAIAFVNGTLAVTKRTTAVTVVLTAGSINEGSSTTVTVTVADTNGSALVNVAPAATITLSVSGTDSLGLIDLSLSSATCTLTDNGNNTSSCMVSVTGLDDPGGTVAAGFAGDAVHSSSNGSAALTVVNVPPTVGAITAPITPQSITTTINTSASFTDPGIFDTHTAVWNWGDNTTSAGTVTENNGSGSVTGNHVYASDGVYTITLTVTDKDGGAATSVFQYLIIFNPNAGFVTGGGWVTSLAGADVPNPTLTGRANFGFNVKYLAGTTTPQGQTEFDFPAVNLNFHSTSITWLVLSGSMAQYQGTGTINGAGNYGFILTAVDGDVNGGTAPDTFRIRIWDGTQGNGTTSAGLIYDNNASAPVYGSPSGSVLGGGEIHIHTSNQTAAGGEGHNPGITLPTRAALQPIWTAALARWEEAGATPAQVSPLAHYHVEIAPLPPGILARTSLGVIWISPDAAGHGWFIDPTPLADWAFSGLAGSPALNRMDLLSVVAHEMGHVILNMEESTAPDDVMTEALPEGVRRLPTPADLGRVPVVAAPSLDYALAVVPALFPTDALAEPVQNPGSEILTDNPLDGALRNLTLSGVGDTAPRPAPAVLPSTNLEDHVLRRFQDISVDDGLIDSLVREP
jgi:hypothetical protein